MDSAKCRRSYIVLKCPALRQRQLEVVSLHLCFFFVALPKKSGPIPLTKKALARHKSLQKYAESRGKRMMRMLLQNLGLGYKYSTEGNADPSSGKLSDFFIYSLIHVNIFYYPVV